jgi:hypothetical protein
MEINLEKSFGALVADLYLEYGYISVPFIQRKLKVTRVKAVKLIEELLKVKE